MLPDHDQKVWPRDTQGTVVAASTREAANAFPHLETQLKLLYTAVTRSCRRVIFAETSEFTSWLCLLHVATGKGIGRTSGGDSRRE